MTSGGPIISVDFGSVRIGTAICESPELPALPLLTIANESRDASATAVAELARRRGASTIVVGTPIRFDGTAGPSAKKVDRFVAALRERFEGEVHLQDERLTTASASKKLAAGELSPSKRRQVIDQMAAVEILESYRARLRRD